MKIKSISDLAESPIVEYALSRIMNLSEPKTEITVVLNNLGKLYEMELPELEKRMSLITRWQNYYGEQIVLAEAIKTAAESQMNYSWSDAIAGAKGTINEKKELAASDATYVKALVIYEQTKAGLDAIRSKFEACDRSFKLISRVLTAKLNIKYE